MSLLKAVTDESIGLTRDLIAGSDVAKAFTQPSSFPNGMQNWDLEGPAKVLVPVITPFRNRIPRRGATGGVQANWKAFTAFNTSNLDIGLSDGNRGGVMVSATKDYAAFFKQLGLEDSVTRGAQLSADGFIDLLAQCQTNLLWQTMIEEEKLDIGGNGSLALGQGNQPSATDVSTGGAIPFNTQVSIKVAPLTLAGYMAGSIAGGVRGLVTRNNADGSTDTYGGGTGQPSTARVLTTANDASNAHSIPASTATIMGSMAYAWFWGASGAETLGAITTINSLVITTAAGTGTQLASTLTADNSINALVYDGLLTQIAKSGYGGYWATQATGAAGTGTPLTADNKGGVVEIDLALKSFWDNYRLSPNTIWVSSQEAENITQKVLTAGSTGAQRFMINSDQGRITGGDLVVSYLNKFTTNGARSLPVMLHPNLPAGTILFDTETVPYPTSGVDAVLVKRLRQDYRAEMFPQISRKYPVAVTFDGVLQNYAPFAFGAITNIANG